MRPLQSATPLAETKKTKSSIVYKQPEAYCGWQIDDQRTEQLFFEKRTRRHYLVPGQGCVLSLVLQAQKGDSAFSKLWVQLSASAPPDDQTSASATILDFSASGPSTADETVDALVLPLGFVDGRLSARLTFAWREAEVAEVFSFMVTTPSPYMVKGGREIRVP